MKSSYKIIKGNPLLNDHTITRYVGGSFVNPQDGSIDGAAFLSKPNHNGRVSYNWLDFFDGTEAEQMRKVRNAINIKNLGASAVFANLNVGNVRETVQARVSGADIIHDPTEQSADLKQDESHCVMTGIPEKSDRDYEESSLEDLVSEEIAECIIGTHPAREPI